MGLNGVFLVLVFKQLFYSTTTPDFCNRKTYADASRTFFYLGVFAMIGLREAFKEGFIYI
jgi:hypothetical protein